MLPHHTQDVANAVSAFGHVRVAVAIDAGPDCERFMLYTFIYGDWGQTAIVHRLLAREDMFCL
jgi:hypothetical protein